MNEHIHSREWLKQSHLIHIVDADPVVCETIGVLLRMEGYRTSYSLDVTAFLEAIQKTRPDATLLSATIGEVDTLPVLRRLQTTRSGFPVLVLCDRTDADTAIAAMKSGARDVITRPIDSARMLGALDDAIVPGSPFAVPVIGRRGLRPGFPQLTPREREVLRHITDGQSNKDTGRVLGISPRTIETHRKHVMEKLGARNTADLIRIVLSEAS